jgi:hypothetical protein
MSSSFKSGAATNHGVDMMTISDGRGVLLTPLSHDPITPTLLASLDQMANRLVVLP